MKSKKISISLIRKGHYNGGASRPITKEVKGKGHSGLLLPLIFSVFNHIINRSQHFNFIFRLNSHMKY